MSLIPLAQAQREVLEGVRPLPTRRVSLSDALGCVLAEAVFAPADVPPFANTAMDGFAVRAADTDGAPVTLEVVGTLAAGAVPEVSVGPGQAVRIMTGAAMPAGADAVAMVEITRPGPAERMVVVEQEVAGGLHVRAAGDDIASGDEVFGPGEVLGPGHLGVLASVGASEVEVHPRARVGVLSTGDELVEGGGALHPGQIRDANRPALMALVGQSGFDAVDLGIARDDEAEITRALERGVEGCDAVLTSGGVSVGDFDLVKVVLDRLTGGAMRWMQVAIRPAKPLAFGTADEVPIFGLPGNPVSSMVSFELFARPALRLMSGHRQLERSRAVAVADEDLPRHPDGKLHLVRVQARRGDDGLVHVRSSGGQGSHMLRAMALADALALVPDGLGVGTGERVEVMLLDSR